MTNNHRLAPLAASESETAGERRARLIAVEGIDGSGKTAVAAELARLATESGQDAVVFRTASDHTPYWQTVKVAEGLLLGDARWAETNQLLHTFEFLMYATRELPSWLARHDLVIVDRYVAGRITCCRWECGEECLAEATVRAFLTAEELPVPDLTVFLEVDVTLALERVASRGSMPEAKEAPEALTAFHEMLPAVLSSLALGPVKTIDGTQRLTQLAEGLWRELHPESPRARLFGDKPPVPMTSRGRRALVEEQERLRERATALRKDMADARDADPDLHVNVWFRDARHELEYVVPRRFEEITDLLERAQIIEESDEYLTADFSQAVLGAKVRVDFGGGDVADYVIVGPSDADPDDGFISVESPLGKALHKAAAGQDVEFDTPGGRRSVKVVSIEPGLG